MSKKARKGRFVIIDIRNMDFQKDQNGNIKVFDTYQEACVTAGIYEHENSWVMMLMYNHIEQ